MYIPEEFIDQIMKWRHCGIYPYGLDVGMYACVSHRCLDVSCPVEAVTGAVVEQLEPALSGWLGHIRVASRLDCIEAQPGEEAACNPQGV